MKKIILTFAMAAMALTPVLAQKQVQPRLNGGVGPVMSGSTEFSSLPQDAQAFIRNLFPDTAVAKVENDFADRQYEVDMSNGYEVTFDYDGNWLQVEAPEGAMLPSSTLTAIMPETVVLTTLGSDALLNGGVTDVIDEITVTPEGYMVEYATGTVGKGKANINKVDGSIMLKAKKDKKMRKGNRQARLEKGDRSKPMRKGMRHGATQARPVVLTPEQ